MPDRRPSIYTPLPVRPAARQPTDGGGAAATQLLPLVAPFRGPAVMPGRMRRIADRTPLAAAYVLIITITLFQRFVVPGTTVSVALPVAFLVLIALAARKQVVADISRTALYLAFVAACLVSTVITSAGEGPAPSITSLLLLVTLYIPLCFRARDLLRERFPQMLRFFQLVMLFAATACLLQWAIQIAGIPYSDLFQSIFPPELLVQDYNTTYPIYYGSPILKANGFVFLEPSFASQFLALAIVIHLMLGGPHWRLVLFGLALATTVSGTGIALLGVGLAVLSVRRGGRWTARVLIASLLVIVAVSLTPLGALLGDRVGESNDANSSGNARFVAPYVSVADAIGRDEEVFLVGRGAGTVDTDVAFFNPQGLLINYSALPKFAGEYGIPASLVFLAFILTVLLRNVPSPTLGAMAAVLYFVLSGSLLQPQTVFLCWLLTGLFAAGRAGEVAGRRIRLSGSGHEGRGAPPSPVRGVPAPRGAHRPGGNRPGPPRGGPRPTPPRGRPARPPALRPSPVYAEPGTTAVPMVPPRPAPPGTNGSRPS